MNDLKKAFKFDETDIAANRQGMATASQIDRLKAKGSFITTLFLLGALRRMVFSAIVIVLLMFVFIGLFSIGKGAHAVLLQMMLNVMIIGAVSLVFGSVPILFLLQKRCDSQEKRVASCNGDFSISGSYDSAYNRIIVSGLTFKITGKETRALRPYLNKTITVYYFPRSRQVASVEVWA
jgi:hypothetical protein